jgi:hypothetical protein
MNAYVHDTHIGKQIKRTYFEHDNNRYCHNVNLVTNEEYFTKEDKPNNWVQTPTTISLELAYETRKSRRLW